MNQDLANQFLNAYYGAMMNNRQNMSNFYSDQSTLNYERKTYQGLQQIIQKYQTMSFKLIQYNFDEFDVQMLGTGAIIVVVGDVQLDGENQFKFSQTFVLLPNNQGGFFISNEIFRFIM